MAVFKLQTNIGDPSFAEVFIAQGGLAKLRHLALYSSGNTLAYSLTSFSRLLELDKGWDFVTSDLISRVSLPYRLAGREAAGAVGSSSRRPGCRVDSHTPPREHPARSHVDTGGDRLSSAYLAFCPWLVQRPVRFPRAEASDRNAPPIPGDARQQALVSGPCVVRKLVAIDQLSHAGCRDE